MVVLGVVSLITGFVLAIFENIVCVIVGANLLWCGIVFILVGDYWNCKKQKRNKKEDE